MQTSIYFLIRNEFKRVVYLNSARKMKECIYQIIHSEVCLRQNKTPLEETCCLNINDKLVSLNVETSSINLVYANIWNLAFHSVRDNIVTDFLLLCNLHVIALTSGLVLTLLYDLLRWKYLSCSNVSYCFLPTPTKVSPMSIFIEISLQRNINRS